MNADVNNRNTLFTRNCNIFACNVLQFFNAGERLLGYNSAENIFNINFLCDSVACLQTLGEGQGLCRFILLKVFPTKVFQERRAKSFMLNHSSPMTFLEIPENHRITLEVLKLKIRDVSFY